MMKYFVYYEFDLIKYSMETTEESLYKLIGDLTYKNIEIKSEILEDKTDRRIVYYLKDFCGKWNSFAYGVAVD